MRRVFRGLRSSRFAQATAVCHTTWRLQSSSGSSSGPTDGSVGMNERFGEKGKRAMQGMISPASDPTSKDARESNAVPIVGKATAKGTRFTAMRSTVFEDWHHVCPAPVDWTLTRFGCNTMKMSADTMEAEDSIQLQIIKGLNVFEFDGNMNEQHQAVSKAVYEALTAFELDRSGFVFIGKGGLLRQSVFHDEVAETNFLNTAGIRSKFTPIVKRFQAASLPSVAMRSGFKISEMSDEQLRQLNMRRVDEKTVATVTPEWIEAALTNIAFHTKIECMDVFLLEGLHTLFMDNRPEEDVDKEIIRLFQFMEALAESGAIQYYGISSPHLAPPTPYKKLDLPKDANMPKKWLNPAPIPETMNLYRIMALAEKAGGKDHKLRFIQYPFNLTQRTAITTPLSYDANHTLATLAKKLGLTTLGQSPIEAPDIQGLPQRYHKFPMTGNLKEMRQHYVSTAERTLLKEMEMAPNIEKNPHSMPEMTQIFLASLLLAVQRQVDNFFFYDEWITKSVVPKYRRGLMKLREGSPADVKDWAKQYDELAMELLKGRHRMFEYEHGRRSVTVDAHIGSLSPTLAKCPIMSQKALNFATYGTDCTLSAFHRCRYFQEATEMNPFKNGQMTLPEDELHRLCESRDVTFLDTNPPDPYMYDVLVTPKVAGQKPRFAPGWDDQIVVDMKKPSFPDCPEEQLEAGEEGEEGEEGDAADEESSSSTPKATNEA